MSHRAIGVLKASKDFQTVLRTVRAGRSPHFELYTNSAQLEVPRLGLAMSRKSAPLSVTRNLAKRIARESARSRTDLPVLDFVIRGRPGLGVDWMQAKRVKGLSAFKRRLRSEVDALFATATLRRSVG